jgi:diguanylate cyclase (GGDEF)-like protein
MLHILVPKDLFEDIISTKTKIVEKKVSNYWKKELLDIAIVNDAIEYKIKTIKKLRIANEFGEEKPNIVVECQKVDYNVKKNIFEFYLGNIIEQRNVAIQADYKDTLIQQLLKEKEALQESMNKDHLTQVYNRRKLDEDLLTFTSQNNAKYLSAVFIDADRFKAINDNFGHDTGDRVLKAVANKIKTHANRLNGEVYRYGGEEFVMLCFLPQEQLLQGLHYLKEDIKSHKILHPQKEISVTVSMGVAFWKNYTTVETFLQEADKSVFKAKHNGRDTIEVCL